MPRRKNGKYSVLLDDLRKKIANGDYVRGEKFPSVRDLSRIYGVCVNTAYRAVKELQKENLIEIMSGARGAYCGRRIDRQRWKKGDTILFMLDKGFFSGKKYYGDMFLSKTIGAAQCELNRHGYKVIFHCMEGNSQERQFMELASGDGIAGVVVIGLISITALKRVAEKLSMPKVVFNNIEPVSNITNFMWNYREIIRETLKTFRKKQFERVCVYPCLGNAWTSASFTYCHEIFEKLAPIYGFPKEKIISINEVYPKNENDDPEKFSLPVRKNASWKSLGILTISSTFAKQLLDAIKKTDLVFGKDIGLVGMNDYFTPEGAKESFSTWDADPEKLGESIADELIESHKNPDIPYSIIRYSGKYINRGTC